MEHTNNNNIWGYGGVLCLLDATEQLTQLDAWYHSPHSIPPHIDVDLFDDEEAARLELTREEWEVCTQGVFATGALRIHRHSDQVTPSPLHLETRRFGAGI